MSHAFVGGACVMNRSDIDDGPIIDQVAPDHFRAMYRLLDHNGAQQKDYEVSFHAIYKFLVANRSEEHWQ